MTEVEKSTKAVISICSAPHRSCVVLELAWLTMPLALFVFPIFNLVLKVNN